MNLKYIYLKIKKQRKNRGNKNKIYKKINFILKLNYSLIKFTFCAKCLNQGFINKFPSIQLSVPIKHANGIFSFKFSSQN